MDRRVTQPKPGYLLSGPPHLHVNRPLVSNFHSDMCVSGGGLETKSIVPGCPGCPRLPLLLPFPHHPPPPTPHPHEQPVYSHSLFERRGGLHTGYRATVRSELSKNVW